MRKNPYRHPVTGHYRDGKYVEKYTRGKGDKPRQRQAAKAAPAKAAAGWRATLYYPKGSESYDVAGRDYVEAVMGGLLRGEDGVPKRVRVRRLQR